MADDGRGSRVAQEYDKRDCKCIPKLLGYPAHAETDKGEDPAMRPLGPTSVDGHASDMLSKPEAIEEK